MAALVGRGELAVDPDPRRVVDRAEAKDRAAGVGSMVEVALVPAARMKAAVVDAAGFRFRREGHLDGVPQRSTSAGWSEPSLVVVGEAPGAVQ